MTTIFPLYVQANGFPSQSLECDLSVDVNSLGDMVSTYRTPLLIQILLLSLCMSQVVGDYLQTAQTWANAGVVLL